MNRTFAMTAIAPADIRYPQRGLTVVGHDDRLARGFDLPEKFKRPSFELGFRHLLVVHDALSKWSLRVVILAENDYIK